MSFMLRNTLFIILFFVFLQNLTSSGNTGFVFDGFNNAHLSLDGSASIRPDGLLMLTNATSETKGHAFYPQPLNFKSTSGRNKILSFQTTFVFSIDSLYSSSGGQGMAFLISPTTDLSTALPGQYLGLFNKTNHGNSGNHIFAVEFDTKKNPEFQDINDNHVGINIDSLKSNMSITAGYFEDGTGLFHTLDLRNGSPIQVWIDFNGGDMQLDITLSLLYTTKPMWPLLSHTFNLSSLMLDSMYVGFSSATDSFNSTTHSVLGWSFKMNGIAEPLDTMNLPTLYERSVSDSPTPIPILGLVLVLVFVAIVITVIRMKKYAEVLEDWELEYGPHRFSYEHLFQATKGFKDKQLLGAGGFGRVYKGVLPTSKMKIAVKKVSHESRQGMKQFVAEIVTIGRLRHRNLVHLLGYCRRKGELLLVYDFMPNGSLDRFLYDPMMPTLNWEQRFRVIKGVASGLLYLHEDWEQVVIHRDIKASNVLLDSELNGKLGDFGLAKLYDHEADPQTTHVAGTMGYLSPELARTGKATTATDIFAFGVFLLEVACGRRPIKLQAQEEELILTDWVLASWQRGSVLQTKDSRLGEDYCADEVELVLKLGLMCSNPMPAARPTMRQVSQFLEGDAPLPELPPSYLCISTLSIFQNEAFDGVCDKSFYSPAASISGISGGR